jgi:replicative DNA helicase
MVQSSSHDFSVIGGGDDDVTYRVMPNNEEAEQALLGAILVNNEVLNRVADFLRADHFYLPVHARIFEAIEQLVERGQIANPITLKTFFERDEALYIWYNVCSN